MLVGLDPFVWAAHAATAEESLDGIPAEALDHWAAAAQTYSAGQVSGRYRTTFTLEQGEPVPDGFNKTFQVRCAWDVAQGLLLTERRLLENSATMQDAFRSVTNSDYRFAVYLPNTGAPNRPSSIRRNGRSELGPAVRNAAESLSLAWCGFSGYGGVPLVTVAENDHEFEIDSVRYVEHSQAARALRVEYRFTGGPEGLEAPENFGRRYRGRYHVVADPSNHWLVIESGCRHQVHGQAEEDAFGGLLTVSYQPGLGGMPFPKKVTDRSDYLLTDGESRTVVAEFEPPEPFAVSAEEFRLTYYGLPESLVESVAGVPDGNRRMRWLLLAVGAVGLALAWWLLRRRREE